MAGKPTVTSMPPEEENELARLIAHGSTPETAAEILGFPNATRIYHAMRTKRFSFQLGSAITTRLKHGAPEAVDVLQTLMRDPKTPARVRADVAKTILDRAGHPAVASSKADDDAATKHPSQMTFAEMEAALAEILNEKADRAQLVNELPADASAPEDFLN